MKVIEFGHYKQGEKSSTSPHQRAEGNSPGRMLGERARGWRKSPEGATGKARLSAANSDYQPSSLSLPPSSRAQANSIDLPRRAYAGGHYLPRLRRLLYLTSLLLLTQNVIAQ